MPLQTAGTRGQFIEENIGLAHSCAHRFKGRGIEYDDLFQAGCMGLVKAFDAFDETRGVMFSTYAVPVILGEIKKLFRDGGSVKVSRRLKELSMKASRLSAEILKRTGAEPSVSELAELLECGEELLVEAICAARPSLSLTSDDGEDETREFDIPVLCGEESIAERLALKDAITRLNEQEQHILRQRFFDGRTQAQTAGALGTTQVQISRRERRIIEKLRAFMGD
jgi:RNA polymerase sporulation-specific sigma factor